MDKELKIMIIDDEAIVGMRLKLALEKIGYNVEAFISSRKAMQHIAQKSYDIIVTDLKMPGIDGMQLFHYVKKCCPATKVIMISGFATIETAKQALKEGVFDFIVKPFKIRQLKEIIMKAAVELSV